MNKDAFHTPHFRQLVFKINKKIGSTFLGNYKSHFKGRGIEFADVRPYIEGDDTKYIHWNISAKENKLYIKQFEETKEVSIYIMIDISRSMSFSNKSDIAFQISSILAISALKSSDKIGMIFFADNNITHIFPAKKGRKHLLSILHSLYHKDQISNTNTFDFDILKKIIKHSTLAFIISDMIDFDKYNTLQYLNLRNQIEVIKVYDPIERGHFKDHIYDFEHNGTKHYLSGKTLQSDYQHAINKYLHEQNQILKEKRIRYCDISTQDNIYKSLLQFFHKYSYN